jgi:hypothetical protein
MSAWAPAGPDRYIEPVERGLEQRGVRAVGRQLQLVVEPRDLVRFRVGHELAREGLAEAGVARTPGDPGHADLYRRFLDLYRIAATGHPAGVRAVEHEMRDAVRVALGECDGDWSHGTQRHGSSQGDMAEHPTDTDRLSSRPSLGPTGCSSRPAQVRHAEVRKPSDMGTRSRPAACHGSVDTEHRIRAEVEWSGADSNRVLREAILSIPRGYWELTVPAHRPTVRASDASIWACRDRAAPRTEHSISGHRHRTGVDASQARDQLS